MATRETYPRKKKSVLVEVSKKTGKAIVDFGMIEDGDDDLVITVMPQSKTTSGEADENIMSEKVVHAMLNEAKLACVS